MKDVHQVLKLDKDIYLNKVREIEKLVIGITKASDRKTMIFFTLLKEIDVILDDEDNDDILLREVRKGMYLHFAYLTFHQLMMVQGELSPLDMFQTAGLAQVVEEHHSGFFPLYEVYEESI